MSEYDRRPCTTSRGLRVQAPFLLLSVWAAGVADAGPPAVATVSFDPPAYEVPEDVPNLLVGLRIDADCQGDLRIAEAAATLRAVESQFAAAGEDFAAVAETVPLGGVRRPPVVIERVVAGLILDDVLPEGDEEFQLTVDLAGGPAECLPDDGGEPFELALSAGGPATVRIVDDEPEVTVSIGEDVEGREGDQGTTAFPFTVTLSPPAPFAVEVSFETSDGTATANEDYEPAAGTLTFEPGQTRRTLTVAVRGDEVVEDDEDFFVDIRSATRGVVVGDGRAVGAILNDDEKPPPPEEDPPELSIAGVSRAEGNSGTTPFDFTVTLSAVADFEVVVRFASRDGTATVADRDYEAVAGTLNFPPGTTRRTISVTVVGDDTREDDETFIVDIATDTPGVEVDRSSAAGTIRDDDDPSRGRIVSGNGQTGAVNQPLPEALVVEVTDDDRRPLAGVSVVWSVARGGAILESEETVTGADGRASNTVVLGPTPGEVVVEARAMGVGEVFTFTLTAVLVIDPSVFDDTERPVAEALAVICPRQETAGDLRRICDDFGGLSQSRQADALRELAPEEASSQGTTAAGAQRLQLGNVGARLAALRGSAGRAASSQIVWNLGGIRLDGGQLAGLFRIPADPPDLARLLEARQGDDEPPRRSPQAAGTSDFGERLGFFLNGTLGRGNRPATSRETGVDFDSLGVTAGVDYRLGERLVVGGALGFQSTDADLDEDAGTVDSEGYSLTAYGLLSGERFYLDWAVLFGRTELESERAIDFPGRPRQIARADPDSDQLGIGLGGGFNRSFKALSFTTEVRLDYLATDVDGYRERGAPGFNLILDEQEIDSLIAALRVQLAYAVSVRNLGVILPTLRLGYLHEFEDPERLIFARFVDDPAGTRFGIPTDAPDRDYLELGLGATAVFPRGRQAYLFFEKDLERSDLNFYRFSFGFRLQF